MAKNTQYKLDWIKCDIGKEWQLPDGWEIISVVMYTQNGQVLVLLRGSEK